MDIDSLQSLCIYLVHQMKYPELAADYYLVSDFLSYSMTLSSRCIFLNVIKGAVDCVIQNFTEEQKRKAELEKQQIQKKEASGLQEANNNDT